MPLPCSPLYDGCERQRPFKINLSLVGSRALCCALRLQAGASECTYRLSPPAREQPKVAGCGEQYQRHARWRPPPAPMIGRPHAITPGPASPASSAAASPSATLRGSPRSARPSSPGRTQRSSGRGQRWPPRRPAASRVSRQRFACRSSVEPAACWRVWNISGMKRSPPRPRLTMIPPSTVTSSA